MLQSFIMKNISVVIPTFRRNKLLKKLITALLNQKQSISEIIVVDNSPEQTALALIKNIKKISPIIIYRYNPSGGVPKARNIGLKIAKSEIVAFLDDDCIPSADWVKQIVDSFSKLKSKRLILMGKNLNGFNNSATHSAEYYLTELVFRTNFFPKRKKIYALAFDSKNCAMMRNITKDKVYFDERFATLTCFEDIDFGIQARQKNYAILYTPEMIASHYGRRSFLKFIKREFERTKGMQLFANKWNLTDKTMQLYHEMIMNAGLTLSREEIKQELLKNILSNKSIFFKLKFYISLLASEFIHRTFSLNINGNDSIKTFQ